MLKNYKTIAIRSSATLKEAVKIIDRHSYYNMAVVTDDLGKFIGILTNGDVTRAMLSGASLADPVSGVVNTNAVVLREDQLDDTAAKTKAAGILLKRQGVFIPILDGEGRLLDVRHYLDVVGGPQEDKVSNKTVLVIGGAGFLGSVLVKRLLDMDYRVVCMDNFVHNNYAVCDFTKNYPKLKIIKADVRNVSHVVRSLEDVHAAILLAAVVGDPACLSYPTDTIEINFLAAKMVSEAARYGQVNRFIYASTCSVYGQSDEIVDETSALNPVSLYARSKIRAEEGIIKMTDEHFAPTIMRMGTLFGLSYRMRFDLVVNTLAMKASTEGKITIFGGEQWRPFLHVRDAAQAYCSVLEAPIEKVRGQVYNVGSESLNYQIKQLGEMIKRDFPDVSVIVKKDSADARNYRVSFDKIQKEVGFFAANNINEGIAEIKEFMRKNNIEIKDPKYSNKSLSYSNGADIQSRVLV